MGEGNEVRPGVGRETNWRVDRALASILIDMLPAVAPYGGRVNVRPPSYPYLPDKVEGFVACAPTQSAGAQ